MTTYAAFTIRVKGEATINPNDALFDTLWPAMLNDAELRILRDLDPLVARKYQKSTFLSTAPANALLRSPTGAIVIRGLDYFTPVATMTVRHPIERRSESFLKDYWPNRSLTGDPKYFCELGHAWLLIAPSPSAAFITEMPYTYRPPSLAVAEPANGTQTTFLSVFHPDLLFYASMVEVAGFKKNYGAMADDPKAALSWEARYQTQLEVARLEEGRRKSGTYADESKTQPPEAAPIQ